MLWVTNPVACATGVSMAVDMPVDMPMTGVHGDHVAPFTAVERLVGQVELDGQAGPRVGYHARHDSMFQDVRAGWCECGLELLVPLIGRGWNPLGR